jgi:gliding motility-associated-like protein
MSYRILSLLILALVQISGYTQCIVINEVMVNAAGPNDGSNAPNTAEWVELYNTCDTDVNVGCYVITDGDFSLTIPAGTILGAGEFFVLGSDNAGIAVNLNWATCGCTSGSGVGIFSNNSEQIALYNSTGILEDGVYWGSGQFPIAITSSALGACASQTISLAAPTDAFGYIISGGGQGCSIGLSCDGGSTWVEFCDPFITGGASNGSAEISASATQTILCSGDCIDFSTIGTNANDTFNWTFEGALTTTSNAQNPSGICYDVAGTYDVILAFDGACGSQTITLTDYITVSGAVPDISPTGTVNACEGTTVLLETTTTGNLQWTLNGAPIDGANSNSFIADVSGQYAVTLSEGNCTFSSEIVTVSILAQLEPVIIPQGPIVICDNQPITLESDGTFDSYQWLLNGEAIVGATSPSLLVNASGDYSLQAEIGSCSGTSAPTTVLFQNGIDVPISPNANTTICTAGSVDFSTANNFATYQWFLDGNAIAGANQFSYSANTAGIYTVQVTNDSGCEGTSDAITVAVDAITTPVVTSVNNQYTFCEGSNLQLTTNNSYDTYNWLLNGQPLGQTAQNVTISAAGNYTVQVTDNNCEASSAPVTITITLLPQITVITNSPLTTCNATADLEIVSDGSVQWLYNGTAIPNANSENLEVSEPGVYTVFATNDAGCVSELSEIIVVFAQGISLTITADQPHYCQGDVAQLSIQGNFSTIQWSNNVQTNTNDVTENGQYDVLVTDLNGCTGEATINIQFDPLPFVDAGQDTITDCDNGVLLSGVGEGTLYWQADETLEDSNSAITIAKPSSNTVYVLVANLNDCTASDEVLVQADCSSLFIPNVFTPNNDGKNDVFEVIARGVKDYHLQIFNRWGNIVFETTNPNAVWTGGKNGYYVPDGTYVWIVYAIDYNNKPLLGNGTASGHVTVLR